MNTKEYIIDLEAKIKVYKRIKRQLTFWHNRCPDPIESQAYYEMRNVMSENIEELQWEISKLTQEEACHN